MYVLGINCAYHESAAALLRDGVLIAAVEEERFSRVKHGKPSRVDNAGELPVHSIAFCLEQAGITLADVDYIGCSMNPEKRLENFQLFNDPVVEGDWGSQAGEEMFYNSLLSVPSTLEGMGFTGKFQWISHHLCHAASAYYPSPFEKAAVLAVDGIGETNSTLLAIGEGNKLRVLAETPYPASLGFLWEKMAKYLGFSEYDACKVMGLAAFGEPEPYMEHMRKLVTILPDGQFELDNDALCFRVEDYSKLEALFGAPKRAQDAKMEKEYANITAALQKITEEVIMNMVQYAYEVAGTNNLCMAGGVALNCVANGIVQEQGPFENLYVQPAAHDAGTALGAAQLIYHMTLDGKERFVMNHAYWGPSFDNDTIEAVLQEHNLKYERLDTIEARVAELLAEQNVIGWFQGAMEFGPRALGNRSLLADPRDPEMKERLNIVVKHREDFRPFAPSILKEEADKWFEISKPCDASDFMLVGYNAKQQDRIPSVVHVDGTSRVQTVKQETNPRYHKLISEFQKITGVPVVLNTSYNDSEPIVCTPRDAVRTFLRANIDALAIGDFLVEKKKQVQS